MSVGWHRLLPKVRGRVRPGGCGAWLSWMPCRIGWRWAFGLTAVVPLAGIAVTRLLVPRARYDEALGILKAAFFDSRSRASGFSGASG